MKGLFWLSKDFSFLKSILRTTKLQADFLSSESTVRNALKTHHWSSCVRWGHFDTKHLEGHLMVGSLDPC